MDTSKLRQKELSYENSVGSAKVNLYTGRLLYEHLDLSFGSERYNIVISHIYNSLGYSEQTYMGNKWKLNLQQYLYKNEENNSYTYIDGLGMLHTFEAISDDVYYDISSDGLSLKINNNDNKIIIRDVTGNKLFFQNNHLVEMTTLSGSDIIIEYEDNKITKVYQKNKSHIMMIFVYNLDELLREIRIYDNNTLIESCKYYYQGTEQLKVVSRYLNNCEKEIVKFDYISNELTSAMNLNTKEGLTFSYNLDKIEEIKTGYLKQNTTEIENPSYYVGDDLHLGEDIYLGEKEIKQQETRYILAEYDKNVFNYSYNNTEVTNSNNITMAYFFDEEGYTVSVLEKVLKNYSIEYRTLQEPTGKCITLEGNSTEYFNFKYALKTTYLTGISKTNLNIELTEDNYMCNFWLKLGQKSEGFNLSVTLTFDDSSSKTFTTKYHNKLVGVWQQVYVPINNVKDKTITNLIINFINPLSNGIILVSDVYMTPSSISTLMLKSEDKEIDIEEVKSITYTLKEEENKVTETKEINSQLYLTEQDLLMNYLQRYLINEDTLNDNKPFYFNNMSKLILAESLQVNYEGGSIYLKEDETSEYYTLPYYVKTISKDGKYSITKQGYVYKEKDVYGYDDEESKIKCFCYEYTTTFVNGTSINSYEYYDIYGRLLLKEDENGVQDIHIYSGTNIMHTEVIKPKAVKINKDNANKITIMTYNDSTIQTINYNKTIENNYYDTNTGLLKKYEIADILDGSNEIVRYQTDYIYDDRNEYLQNLKISDLTKELLNVNYTYDEDGQVSVIEDANNKFLYEYDKYGNIVKVQEKISKLDEETNEMVELYVERYFQENDRELKKITAVNNGHQTTAIYDEYNKLKQYQNNGYDATYDYYDTKGSLLNKQLESIKVKKDGELVEEFDYEYDENNLPKKCTRKQKCDRLGVNGENIISTVECKKEITDKDVTTYFKCDLESFDDNITNITDGHVYRHDVVIREEKLYSPRIASTGTEIYKQGSSYLAEIKTHYDYDEIGRTSKKQVIAKTRHFEKELNINILKQRSFYPNCYNPQTDKFAILNENENIETEITNPLSVFNYNYYKGNLQSISRPDLGDNVANYYEYDEYNRLLRETSLYGDVVKSYTYDEKGNVTSKTIDKDNKKTILTYHNDDKLLKKIVDQEGNEVYNDIQYDEYGNCIEYNRWGNPYKLTWQNGKYLSNIEIGELGKITYQYDINGRRISKNINGDTLIEYFYEGNKLLWEFIYNDDGYIKLSYLYDKEGIMGFVVYDARKDVAYPSHKFYYYIKDALGNVISITDSESIIATYEYDAWGNHTISGSNIEIANLNPIRYRGYYYDVETNLFLVSSRYYSPELCRWISPDDIEYLDPESVNGLNLYCYCLNNPIMYADPTGHFAIWVFLGVVAISAIAGAIDGGVTAAMSGQNFWKGFAAGAIGGAVGGVINYFLPGAGNLLGRAASTMIYDITNEIFQTGTFDINNLGLYVADTFMDVTLSLLYLDKVGSIANPFISAAVGGAIDAGVDIIQTPLYFTPEAQQRIRGTNNKNNRTNSIYVNRLTYAY